MSNFPYALDDDSTIYVVDDNTSELSGLNFNQARDAIFRIEEELGIKPSGSMDNLKEFLDVSFNTNGTIKGSALTAVGLASLPIDNAQVGTNAGILESKLNLDYSTSSLKTLISANSTLLTSLQTALNGLTADLNSHTGGGTPRHVAGHIDLNAVPTDPRDPLYTWTGLLNKNGTLRAATTVAQGLLEINNELVGHENSTGNAHTATAISVDTSDFTQLSEHATNVQLALNELDASEDLRIGIHRATQHSSGVPADARSDLLALDGYGDAVVSRRQVSTHVNHYPPGTGPVDDVVVGDNIVQFIVPSTPTEIYQLDSEFSQVKPGDVIRILYGDGYNYEAQYLIDSVRYVPGTTYFIRLNSNNLVDTTDAYARIDRNLYDPNVYAVAMSAPSNADFPGLRSITIADPRCASVLGIGFDANQIDSTHYKLYLELYPTGNPVEKSVIMPAIDITGNAGITPGKYTLEGIVLATNNAFRASGYNMRFIAFHYEGNFGIALSDPFDGASFSIITGDWSSGSGTEGAFTENIIGDFNPDGKYWDALGLSANAGNWASPAYRGSYANSTDAQNPTKIFFPRKNKSYIANGSARDYLKTSIGVSDGYYQATITNKTVVGFWIETTYEVYSKIDTAGLLAGKTITVLPIIDISSPSYDFVDYGRFVIKSVSYTCGIGSSTLITVVDGVHASPGASGTPAGLIVRLYFGNDTVGFNSNNVIDASTPGPYSTYHRFFETYVNKDAETLSHERARMPIQSGTGTALDTTFWHINYISPKLRGYRDNTANLNKYIRLIIDTYDAVSGEYTSRIGRRPVAGDTIPPATTTLTLYGQTATGRKNTPCIVYDETGHDYIEIEFVETSSSATAIVPNRVADIELFSSLMEDDELTLLSTCEINTSSTLVERVVDRRNVGSISELEFTASARNYIVASDKSLHTSGVIRDLDCLGLSDPTDTAAVYFRGGEALVNGKVVVANNAKVIIPNLKESGGSSSTEWVICLNEEGTLIPLPLTATKKQFFALAGGVGTAYYVPSITFVELIAHRKDLVPLATLTATISPLVITNILDIRRFVADESQNIPFVWSEDDTNTSASFTSAEALQNWITRTTNFKQKVLVRGNINIATALDFRAIPYLTLEAEGLGTATLNITSNVGIYLNDNATIKNIVFTYSNTLPAGNILNIGSNYGAIVIYPTASTTIRNITVKNCWFMGTGASYRAPFIYMLLNNNIVEKLNIIENKFSDAFALTSAAVVISEANFDGLAHSIISNVFIEKNICSSEQGIFILGQTTSALSPIEVINVHISKNKCGYIGVFTSSDIDTSDNNVQGGLSIDYNNCNVIYSGNILTTGALDSTNRAAVGNLNISNNTTGTIHCAYTSWNTPRLGQSAVNISGNTIVCTTLTAPTGVGSNAGITVDDAASASPYLIPAKIVNNTIKAGSSYSSATVLEFVDGIRAYSPCIVADNDIRGFTQYGIRAATGSYTDITGSLIHHNMLFRGSNVITAYIYTTTGSGTISENYLDSMTIDGGTNYNTILRTLDRASGWIVSRNKNHVNYFYPQLAHGNTLWLFNGTTCTYPVGNSILWARIGYQEQFQLKYDSTIGTSSNTSEIRFPLEQLLPEGAYVISANLTVWSSTIGSTATIVPSVIYNTSHTIVGSTIASVPASLDFTTSAITQTAAITVGHRASENLQLAIQATVQNSSSLYIYFDVSIMYTF